jgi:hypothetical protein
MPRIKSHEFEVEAEIRLPIQASLAFSTWQARIDGDRLPDLKLCCCSGADPNNTSCRFMPQDERARRGYAADFAMEIGMEIASADPHRRYLDQ